MTDSAKHHLRNTCFSAFRNGPGTHGSLDFECVLKCIRGHCWVGDFPFAYEEAKMCHKSMQERIDDLNSLPGDESHRSKSNFCLIARILGELCMIFGYLDEAILLHLQILRNSKDNSVLFSCHVSLASLYIKSESWLHVLEQYECALGFAPTAVESRDILANMGNAYLRLGEFSNAIDAYTRVSERTPENVFNLLIASAMMYSSVEEQQELFVTLSSGFQNSSLKLVSLAAQLLLANGSASINWLIEALPPEVASEFVVHQLISQIAASQVPDHFGMGVIAGRYGRRSAKVLLLFLAIHSYAGVPDDCTECIDEDAAILVNRGIIGKRPTDFDSVLKYDACHIEANFNKQTFDSLRLISHIPEAMWLLAEREPFPWLTLLLASTKHDPRALEWEKSLG